MEFQRFGGAAGYMMAEAANLPSDWLAEIWRW
jgi:hypothetical protein